MDVLLLCITILMALIVFGVSFYMLVIYIHTDEKGIGNSIPAKIVVVLGLGLSWGQLLLVPLDVSNALDDGGIDMPTCYTVIYIIVLVYLVGLSPFTMFFYESDEEDTICSRLTWSFIFTFIIAGISCAAIFVSQIWLSVYAPGQSITTTMYIMLCLSFFGYFLLAIFGGMGLIALPVDFIKSFSERPKALKPQEAKKKKTDIEESSAKLVEMGEKLRQEETQLSKVEGWWATRKQSNRVNKLFDKFKQDVIELEQRYQTFQAELKIQQQNPVLPYLSLVVGILCCFFSLVWIVQLYE